MNQSMVVYSVNPGDDYGNALVIQPDGKILVAGATHNGTDWDWYIVRLMPDGALDGTFGTGGIVTTDLRGFNDWGTSIALQPDGKIVFGSKNSNGTDTDFAVARYNPDGSLDGTFGTGGKVFTPIGSGNDDGSRVTLQPDGKIVLAGWYVNGTDDDFAIVRYNTDGSLDSSFGSGASSSPGSVRGKTESPASPSSPTERSSSPAIATTAPTSPSPSPDTFPTEPWTSPARVTVRRGRRRRI